MGLYHATSGSPVAVQHHQIKGQVGYTVVGSPIIADGVASGFSNNDYLISDSISGNISEYMLHVEFTTGTTLTGKAVIVGTYAHLYGSWGFILDSSGRLLANIYLANGDDTTQSAYYEFYTGVTVTNNQKYYAELYFSNKNKNIISKVSTDEENWTTQTVSVYDNAIPGGIYFNRIIGFGKGQEGVFNGSIDLNHTYIKINDSLWFYQPQETKYIKRGTSLVYAKPSMYLTGPVNYSVVGNPTIVDGVASGFSSSNYLQLNNTAVDSIKSFQIVSRFTTPATSWNTSQPIFSYLTEPTGLSNLYSSFYITSYGPVGAYLFRRPDNTYQVYTTNTSIDLRNRFNQTFTAVLTTDMSTVTFDLYDASNTLLATNEYTNQNLVGQIQPNMRIGVSTNLADSFAGSIYLNHTYIKVNDALWFYGKNYATSNIAPVPEGFSYNNTTAPSIGYVDMRTQTFSPAPYGAHFALPSGYTEVRGVKGDGTAYIDLGLSLTNNDDIEVDIGAYYTASTQIFGYRDGASSQNISIFTGTGSNSLFADFNNSNYATFRVQASTENNMMYKVVISKTARTIYDNNGNVLATNNTLCEDTITTGNAYMFFMGGTPASTAKFSGTIYRCIVKGKADLVPCVRTSDSAVGFYDTIRNVFFTNANSSGSFSSVSF